MQVKVENTTVLERRLTIEIPAKTVDNKINERIQDFRNKARIDGFRPGKAPLKLIEQKFSGAIHQEVIDELMRDSFVDALKQEKLNPVGTPQLGSTNYKKGESLQFTAIFEVYPEIRSVNYDNFEIEKSVATITEDDIDKVIEQVRQQHASWKEADRPAQLGDELNIDFEGRIADELFEGGSHKSQWLVLGSNTFIKGFEEGLVGQPVGAEIDLQLEFPKEYHAAELAGKPVNFHVKINQLFEKTLPDIDATFIKQLGIEPNTVVKLREEVRTRMNYELDKALKNTVKSQVLRQLCERNVVEVPKAFIDMEMSRLKKRMQDQMRQMMQGQHTGKLPFDDQLFEQSFQKIAQTNVATGILINTLSELENIKSDPETVDALIKSYADNFDDKNAVISAIYSNKEKLSSFEVEALEQKVVDTILGKAKITEKTVGYFDVIKNNLGNMEEGTS